MKRKATPPPSASAPAAPPQDSHLALAPLAPLMPLYGEGGLREALRAFFPSDESLRWHMRHHRDAYLKAGALVFIAGRDYGDRELFPRVLRGIGRRKAAERAAD